MPPKNSKFRPINKDLKPELLDIPPPPPDSTNSQSSKQYLPYKTPGPLAKNPNAKRSQSYNISNTNQRKTGRSGESKALSFNLVELQLQAQLLSDLQSLKPIIQLIPDDDSLGIKWTYTKIDSMFLNDINYNIRVDEVEEDKTISGDTTPRETSQNQLLSQHSISSSDSISHDFNDFTYWLVKGKKTDLAIVENMIKTPGFNYIDVPRNLLSIAAQVFSRGFFDPSYRTYLDQMDEKIY